MDPILLIFESVLSSILITLMTLMLRKLDKLERRVTRIETYLCYKNSNYRELVRVMEHE